MSVSVSAELPLMILCGGGRELAPYGGRPWLLRQLERVAGAGITSAVVVIDGEPERFRREIPLLGRALERETHHEGLRLRAVEGPRPARGLLASIQAGMAGFEEEEWEELGGAFVLPSCVPCPEGEIWGDLRACLLGGPVLGPGSPVPEACVPEFEGKPGYPVALSRGFLERLASAAQLPVEREAGFDAWLRKRLAPGALLRIPSEDPRVAYSLDPSARAAGGALRSS